MNQTAIRRGNSKNKDKLIGQLRIGELEKSFSFRFGNGLRWQFPNDDDGLECLKILLHTYAWAKPWMLQSSIIELRAPWADAGQILAQVKADPRRWTAVALGKELGFDGREWIQDMRFKTIAPIDLDSKERRYLSRVV